MATAGIVAAATVKKRRRESMGVPRLVIIAVVAVESLRIRAAIFFNSLSVIYCSLKLFPTSLSFIPPHSALFRDIFAIRW
jgi:hypothetical protein